MWLADYARDERKPNGYMFEEEAETCREALSAVDFVAVPTVRPPAGEPRYCEMVADAAKIGHARTVCTSTQINALIREDIIGALDEVEKNRVDTVTKFCTSERLRCDAAADRDACLKALPWPGTDIYRPRVR